MILKNGMYIGVLAQQNQKHIGNTGSYMLMSYNYYPSYYRLLLSSTLEIILSRKHKKSYSLSNYIEPTHRRSFSGSIPIVRPKAREP